MAINRAGENTLTYLLQRIKAALEKKVDKVDGKVLSSNDYTAAEKSKLAGIEESANKYELPTGSTTVKGGFKVGAGLAVNGDTLSATGGGTADSVDWSNVQNKPTFADVATSGDYDDLENKPALKTVATSGSYNDLTNKPTIPTVPAISTNIETDAASDAKTASPKAVKTYIDSKVSAVYKPQGSVAFASLPALSASILGNVYNITNAFVTTADFIEGAGHSYSAGQNVVCVKDGSSYKWDVLAGTVDLSGYTPTAENTEITNTEVDTIWNTVFGA